MIQGSQVVQRLLAIMPAQETVTLKVRQSAETGYTSGTSWRARREIPDQQIILLAGGSLAQQWLTLQLYLQDQTVLPKSGDKITDAGGATWQVKQVHAKQEAHVFDCLCLKEIA